MKKYSIWDWGYWWEYDSNVAVLHTVTCGCWCNITRAGNDVISTGLCLYSWGGTRPIKAFNTENREHCRDGDATAAPWRGINEKIWVSPTVQSGCTVTELELSIEGGLQGAHSPHWPRHSWKRTLISIRCTSSFHIFHILAHADTLNQIHFQMSRCLLLQSISNTC